ncbi:hypothetical protein CHOED_059 [Vibrio phage CHOED]|uniref:hypothetical protein n=1 Tax=Vibrio phage CHOED TaxID=1458716 RepID=UPI00042F3437|nr:hypothetical protein CHOED_059 [Vibrio phage CHOED]AHK11919.1 hypothetical protein CHOED_059 [Vibrio phage CHOED]
MSMAKGLTLLTIVAATIGIGAGLLGFHSLDNGERAVARDFFGNTRVIFTPGPFYNFLGDVEVYPDYMGLDFTAMPEHDGVKAAQLAEDSDVVDYTYAPAVKYNEGGIGWVKGNVQFALPGDADMMLSLHKKYKTASNLQTTLMLRTTEEALQFTAGLMSSQEAYMTHRTQFRTYAKDQIDNGLYATKLIAVSKTGADGEISTEMLPKVMTDDKGQYIRADVSPIDTYDIRLTQFNIQDWDFEGKTKAQIALKRDAENEVITSKARTARAEQEKLEAIAIADKNKSVAAGIANVEKERAVIAANKTKELAVIRAQQGVATAKEMKAQREEEYQAALKEAKTIEALSKANAEANDRLIKSGGQLSAAQKTQIEINSKWAEAYSKKAVPTYNIGDSNQAGSSLDASQQAMQTLSLKAMNDMVNKK